MSEADEQKAVIAYCDARNLTIFHIPNEAQRSPRTAAHLKAMGMRKGVPDLMMPIPRGKYHGLFIEMKVKPNKLSSEQFDWLRDLRRRGYAAFCCYGARHAIELIRRYEGLDDGEGL